MAISLPGFTYNHCHFLSFLGQYAISQGNLTWQHCKFCYRILESQQQNLFQLCAQSPAFSPFGGCKSCFRSWVRSSKKPWVGFICLSLSKHHEQSIGTVHDEAWAEQGREKESRGSSLPLLTVCAITFCALISTKSAQLLQSPLDFLFASLCSDLIQWPVKGMFLLSCCSYRIIKDRLIWSYVGPQRAKSTAAWDSQRDSLHPDLFSGSCH